MIASKQPQQTTNKPHFHHLFFQRELIYIYFQAFRKTKREHIELLSKRLNDVLSLLKSKMLKSSYEWTIYLKHFFKLIAHVRTDKGEHDITYMMIHVWYKHFPSLTMRFIQQLVSNDNCEIQLGCWRDMKYLCDYVYTKEHNTEHPIISFCVFLLNDQLAKDLSSYSTKGYISNVSKWIPREHKKFDWLFKELVNQWFSRTDISIDDNYDYSTSFAAMKNHKCIYRKNISMLNKILDTTQIKQCSQKYDEIIPENVSKLTYVKQPTLTYDNINNYKEYMSNKFLNENPFSNQSTHSQIHNQTYDSNIPIYSYIKEAFALLKPMKENNANPDITYKIQILNSKWQQLSSTYNNTKGTTNKYIIPLLDISYTMQEEDDETYYTAIGIAILLAENSLFNKRILCVDHLPTWLNISNERTLTDIINAFENTTKSSRFTFSNIIAAIDILAFSIINTKIDEDTVKQLQIVILSDFHQIEADINDLIIERELDNTTIPTTTLYDRIKSRFSTEYKPNIVFWNLSKRGFIELPCSIYQENTLFLSGYSQSQIKTIIKYRYKYPHNAICSLLQKNKYNILDKYVDEYMS